MHYTVGPQSTRALYFLFFLTSKIGMANHVPRDQRGKSITFGRSYEHADSIDYTKNGTDQLQSIVRTELIDFAIDCLASNRVFFAQPGWRIWRSILCMLDNPLAESRPKI